MESCSRGIPRRRPPMIARDPFEPLFKEEKQKPKEPKEKKRVLRPPPPPGPLTERDLNQFKLTAIISTPVGNRALVEEASGKGYILEEGTWIGVHYGRVQKITRDAVIVEEEVENALGEISLTKRELKLQKPPGE